MAGTEIGDLIELLSSPESDLYQKLGSDSVKSGLKKLYLIFNYGVQSTGDGKAGFQNWNQSQIQALVSVAQTLVSATKSLSADQAEPTVVQTVLKVLEFSALYLEKSDLTDDDLSIQNDVAHVLEIALIDGISKECDAMHPRPGNAIVDSISVSDCGDIESENNYKCISQGVSCSRFEKPIDRLLMALETDSMLPDNQAPQFFVSTSYQDLNKLVSVSRHWAVVHMGCLHRFITLCKENIECINIVDEKVAVINFLKRLSFSLRVLKLLVNLAKVIPRVEFETNLLQEIVLFTDALPRLFRHGVEYAYSHTPAESSFESLGLSVMEEFLDFVRLIFFNNIVYQNVQACIIASMLDNLDSSIWRYNKCASNLKPPLAYFPRSVIYILKLLENIQIQKYQAIDRKDIERPVGVAVDFQSDSLSCHVNSERISLLKKYSVEELLQVIFPSSKNWVDNIMNLIYFLHSEGSKLKPKLDRSYSSCTKSTCISEMDNTAGHEDEALFGDLFSEGGRSVGSIEDQPAAAVNSISSYYNLPNQVASDLLRFLKVSVFSPEWHHSIFDDGCKKLTRDHIVILLSILNCQECCPESDEGTTASTLHEQSKMGHLHEICFELLHNLITHHAMSDSIEEYLVEQILKAERGIFVYNDQTLTLLAHVVICRSGPAGVQLRTQMYRGFVEFLLEKAKALLLESPSISEVLRCLPSIFHIEILLMAFHLSSEKEKATFASFIFCSLGEIDAPTAGFINSKQLMCVALLLSRLVLVLRHMIFHSSICPPSLLLDLRSRFKKVHIVAYNTSITTAYLASWASVATESVTGGWVKEDSDMRNLLNQLIDVATFPASLCGDDFDIKCLNLSWDAIFASFSRIMGFWKSKKASLAEDLIVERYIFSLCWDIPLTGSEHLVPLWDKQNLDTSNMEYFFHFSHALLGNVAATHKVNSPNVLNVFQQLHEFQLLWDIEEPGWDLLRCDMWLSLFLSLLNVGISRYNMKSSISEGGPIMTEKTSRNNGYFTFAEDLVSSLFDANEVPVLLKTLSSILSRCLKAYEKACLYTLDNSQSHSHSFPLVLLLKHSCFDQSMQFDLHEKCGSILSQLDSVYKLLLKLDSAIDRRGPGIIPPVLGECMLHGIPSHHQVSSGFLVSFILTVRGIVRVLEGLLKIKDGKGKFSLETEVSCQILDLVMTIKSDRIFGELHQSCEDIYHCLTANLGGSDYRSLYLLKQMEKILRDINASGVGDGTIHECILTKVIDCLNILRDDPSRADVFKFYICAEDTSEEVKRIYFSQRGELMVLIDSLDICLSESANLKVLNVFSDLISGELSPGLKQQVQTKFLNMDLPCLSKWLEKRMLGCISENAVGVTGAKGNSVALRESTVNFVTCLIFPPSELHSRKLHDHMHEAMLILLDSAFLLYDIQTAKSYFHFVVQLSSGEMSMKLLLKRTIMLMEKLARDESHLQGLQFLFCFLRYILTDCKSHNNTSEKSSGKSLSSGGVGLGYMVKPAGSRKISESLVLSASEGVPTFIDATSVDDDEDDGTSDGEVASLDKDEEEDASSDKALASKVCTFTSSGSNFMEQHWYFCYTCDLTVSKGCCSVCAKVCHRGHRVVYSRSSRFFCDCGAGGSEVAVANV